MNSELQTLIQLQAIDDSISQLNRERAEIPGRVEAEKKYLKEFEDAVGQAKSELEDAKKRQREAEGSIQTADQKLRDIRGKQAMVKTNEEYRALSNEIEALQKEIGSLEDQVLELMEGAGGLEERLVQEQKKLEEARAKVEAATRKLKEDQVRIERRLEELRAGRKAKAAEVGSAWMSEYQKLRQGRNGIAVCPVVERACQACRMSETLQRFIEIRDSEDEIFTCSHCGRILYFMEPEALSAASGPEESA